MERERGGGLLTWQLDRRQGAARSLTGGGWIRKCWSSSPLPCPASQNIPWHWKDGDPSTAEMG